MSNHDSTGASKKLSWLLRHGAGEAGLEMDAAGWAEVDDVRRVLHIGHDALEAAVRDNTKARLERRGTRIRACQGHSLQGMPVTCDALEATWEPHEGDAPVFHGTRVAALQGIAREGILPGERTHVHLAEAIDSAVGKRAAVDVMLAVSPARLREHGLGLHRSPNGVILTRHVPAACIAGLVPVVDKARRQERQLRGLFGWEAEGAPSSTERV
jgi:putative RNA 2'-phosphotransferase